LTVSLDMLKYLKQKKTNKPVNNFDAFQQMGWTVSLDM